VERRAWGGQRRSKIDRERFKEETRDKKRLRENDRNLGREGKRGKERERERERNRGAGDRERERDGKGGR